MITQQQLARICHETNRSYCAALGDHTQPAWENAPGWQREASLKQVEFALANPDAPPSHTHDSWAAQKIADGWTRGPVKDSVKKEHPSLVPYEQLHATERAKDSLFAAVVNALRFMVKTGP